RRIEPDRSDDYCQDQESSGGDGDFCNKNDLPTPLYNVGELLNAGFDVQDLFVQVPVVIHLKSTLPRQIHGQPLRRFIYRGLGQKMEASIERRAGELQRESGLISARGPAHSGGLGAVGAFALDS